ncbi:hypothetical protein ANN_09873, partial [Periplaneta americana]
KAFDTVDNDLLLCNLKNLNLSDNAVAWFQSYLRDRQQCTLIIGDFSSERRFTKSGVPQGILFTSTPKYLKTRFEYLTLRNQHQALLFIPRHRTSFYSSSFTVSVCRLWNSLPRHVRDCRTVNQFKLRIKNYTLLHEIEFKIEYSSCSQDTRDVQYENKFLWRSSVGRVGECLDIIHALFDRLENIRQGRTCDRMFEFQPVTPFVLQARQNTRQLRVTSNKISNYENNIKSKEVISRTYEHDFESRIGQECSLPLCVMSDIVLGESWVVSDVGCSSSLTFLDVTNAQPADHWSISYHILAATGVEQTVARFPADPELRSVVGSIAAWTDYLVLLFPRFSSSVRRMSDETCCLSDRQTQYSSYRTDVGSFVAAVTRLKILEIGGCSPAERSFE